LKARLPVLYGSYDFFGNKKLSFTRAERFREKSPKELKEV
jgi:hypothetical protein